MSTTVVVRALLENEAAEIAGIINAVSRAEYGVDDVNEAEIRRWFAQPDFDVERDVFVAEQAGRVSAYADVSDEGKRGEQFWIDVRLPPDGGEAAGAALLAAAEARAAELAAGRPRDGERRLISGTSSVNERLAGVLENAGYRLYRHSFRMEIDLGGDLPEAQLPEGIDVGPFASGDERAVFDAMNEAFEDTWDHVLWDFEEWRHWTTGRDDFDPTLWWLARDGDELAGASLCRVHEIERDMGWVSTLAVRRRWRRRGLARALLGLCFHEFRRRGLARVGLGVDADSLTGANRLYESAGMRPVRRWDLYEKRLG
jgi:mycothiol synthase